MFAIHSYLEVKMIQWWSHQPCPTLDGVADSATEIFDINTKGWCTGRCHQSLCTVTIDTLIAARTFQSAIGNDLKAFQK